MKFSSRKGLQLAASTLVLLIVGIIILGSAIALTYNVVCAAETYTNAVDSQTQSRINRLLLQSGSEVYVGDNTQTAEKSGGVFCGGSSDYTAKFVVGIKNVEAAPVQLELEIARVVPAPEVLSPPELQFFASPQQISQGETIATTVLFVSDPAMDPGQYVYRLRAKKSGTTQYYGDPQQFYLTIE